MMGATNPADSAPGTIRGDYAHAALGEHRARLRLEGEREARALAVLPRRPALSAGAGSPGALPSADARDLRRREAQPRGLDEGERRVHRRAREREVGRGGDHLGRLRRPESDARQLGDVDGLDVVELGCGTAYVSAWLARRGARPGRRRRDPGPARDRPPLPGGDRDRIPARRGERRGRAAPVRELRPRRLRVRRQHLVRPAPLDSGGARLLRPGGRLWFLRNSTISILCAPDDGDAERDPGAAAARPRPARVARRDRRRVAAAARRAFPGPPRRTASSVDLIELYAPDDAEDHAYYDAFSAEWSRKWPVEEIWVAKKPG